MTCAFRSLHSSFALVVASALLPAVLGAQLPAPSVPATPPVLAPYRVPALALVQPAAGGGGTVPQDRPVVVFRFTAGEADDPLDGRSFLVTVDGVDRTALFQATATQAWGPLADDEALRRGQLAAGPHRIVARICSSRGACTTAESQVLVVPGLVNAGDPETAAAGASRTRRVVGAVVGAARKLLLP